MILSAIYIQNHFLFQKPQIVNFGGKYFFSINSDGLIEKKENEDYIPNFYNSDTVLSLSAIVGRNGAGKSSLLEIITNSLNNQYGFISTVFFEDNDKILIPSKGDKNRYNFSYEEYPINNSISTFYYSPFLDFKSNKSGVDISFDYLVESDLNNISEKRKSSSEIEPLQQLKMKNEIRQMNFKNSEVGSHFCEVFDLPSDNLNKLTFTRYIIEVDHELDKIKFHDTPYAFRDFIQFIYSKIRQEANELENKKDEKFQKNLFKNYFLMDLLCLLIHQMEKQNKFLEEGFVDINIKDFKKEINNKSAKDSLIYFLENHYYKYRNSEKFTLLPVAETEKLINNINNYIDEADIKLKHFNWKERSIYLQQDKAIELLELQNAFLNKVNSYYESNIENFTDFNFKRENKIEDFINFLPSERALSSGENALLNLFSRFHEALENIKFYDWNNNTNIVLLDEADLGFHPKWKKQFVQSILFFFDIYFKSYRSSVQIIFTTHDPLTLSDILNYNVVYLEKKENAIFFDHNENTKKSFGANISDLLADSFFLEDGLIGDFSKNKIQDVIEYINDESGRSEKKWIASPIIAKKIIEQIGEPYLSDKLNDMFLEAFPEFKNDEIKELEKRLNKLKYGTDTNN